jgi:glycosyltransferase involved in cell wall biosynthesis
LPRVVRIQSRICIGGPALHSILLSEGLSHKRGSRYDTTLIGGALEPGEASMEAQARARGVDVTIIPEMKRAVRPGHDAHAIAKVVSLLRRLRPAIVHTHTAKAGAIGRVAARIAQVPIVVHTFHGHVFDGYFSNATTRAFIAAERMLAIAADRVLAISDQQRWDLVHRYQIVPDSKVRVVPLGLELDRFRAIDRRARGALRRELGIAPSAPVAAAIGRLVPVKRFDHLINAFAEVVALRPDAHLVLAGDGEATHRAELERLAARVPNVHFLGWRRDLEAIYADADVFALTSDNEGTPVAVIEAVASGVPVVATQVGGVEDVVKPGMGLLVPRGDPQAIARAMVSLFATPVAVPEALRDEVVRRFSHRRLIADIESLYDELLSTRRGRAHREEARL